MDNSGGAKPKTMTSTNNNNNNGANSQHAGASGSTPVSGAPPRHRSQRMENGFVPRTSGRAIRGVNYSSNGSASRPSAEDAPNRRATVPSSTGRARHSSSTQTRSGAPQHVHFSDYSPLRGASRLESRSLPWQNGNPDFRRRSRYLNPMPRIRSSMHIGPLESPRGDVFPPLSPLSPCLHAPVPQSPSLHGILSSSEDSDSESGSPMSPLGSSQLQSPASVDSLALPPANSDRPTGMSRDAVLARELLQSEMDMMMQHDEEMARQLQDYDRPNLSMLLNSGVPARRHRFPNLARRLDGGGGGGGYSGQGRERRLASSLRFLHSSPERSEADPMYRRAINLFGVDHARGAGGSPGLGRTTQTEGEGRRRRLRPRSPDVRNPSTMFDEYDPEERLLTGGLEPPDDFLTMMNDPSLMLLMLLLRAPDSLHQNDATDVDLDDYEALWDLAEELGEVRRRGITEGEIDSLPTRKFKSPGSDDEASDASAAEPRALQCQICLVDFENGDCLRCIPCKHDFHKDCLDEWLKRNATCPICRQDLRP